MATSPILPDNMPGQAPLRGPSQGNRPIVWGILLLLAGLATLAGALDWFQNVSGFVFAALFAAGGLLFLYLFLSGVEQNWWAAIPAFALFGLAGTILVTEYAPERVAFLGGATFLGALGLGFLLIYLVRRTHWWALIPAGVMLSLAATAAISESPIGSTDDTLGGAIFMGGLGLTFLVVALTSADNGLNRWWAFIPAVVLMVLAVLIFASAEVLLSYVNILWALALLGAGGYLLWRGLQKRNG